MMEFEGFQKLVSRNLEFNNKAVEETLLGVGKWALLSLRIPGYFPLTICRSNSGLRLELVKCSTVAFYTIFITILTLLGNGFFYYKFITTFLIVDDRPDSSTNYGDVESFIWFSLMVLVTYTTYLRFSRIFFCRGSLRFWEKTVALMETIVRSGYSLNSKHFQNTFSSIRAWVIFYFTIAGIRISYGGYLLYTDFIDPTITNSALATSFLDFFLAITLCFHVGYNVWLTFLVKIITICYETIHEDLDGMSCPRREDSSSFKTPDNFRHHPMGLGYYAVTSGGAGGGEMEKKNKIGFLHLERKIEQTIKTYEVVEEHMHHFNRFFGVTLIMETTFAMIILLVNVYAGETSIFLSPIYTVIVMGTPIMIYSSALFHFSSDSAILSGRAVAVLKKLERFFIPNDRQELQTLQLKVIALIARVADNPPTISAAHFFTLNRHLLTSVLGTITTYLIVLMQFGSNDTPPTTMAPTTATEKCPADLTWICYCGKFLKESQKSSHTAYTH